MTSPASSGYQVYAEKTKTFFKENGFALGAVATTALAAFFIGMFVWSFQVPSGDITCQVPSGDITHKEPVRMASMGMLVGSEVALVFGLLATFLFCGAWVDQFAKKQVDNKALKVTRTVLMLLGLAVTAFGVGFFAGATAIKEHHTFAENAGAYTPDRWKYLQDMLNTQMGGGIAIAALGGLIGAGGIAIRVAEKICSIGAGIHTTFRVLATGKRLAQEKNALDDHLGNNNKMEDNDDNPYSIDK